jgi:hypothetical protein
MAPPGLTHRTSATGIRASVAPPRQDERHGSPEPPAQAPEASKARPGRRRDRNEGRASFRDLWGSAGAVSIGLAIAGAAEALHHGREDAPELIGWLVGGPPVEGGRHLVARQLLVELRDEVVELREKQWRPREVQRFARRALGASGAAVAVAALDAEALRRAGSRVRDEWAAEVTVLDRGEWRLDPDLPSWPEDLRAALGVLGLFRHLPRLPGLGSSTSRSRDRSGAMGKDEQILDKVRGLLSKAESTSYPDEAASLTAKAQELLNRHSIDGAGGGGGEGGGG